MFHFSYITYCILPVIYGVAEILLQLVVQSLMIITMTTAMTTVCGGQVNK